MEQSLNTVRSIFGNNVADYLASNSAEWVIERFSDTRKIERGPNAGKMECLVFAASATGQEILLSCLMTTTGAK